MSSRVNEVSGEKLQDPPIKNPGYANGSIVVGPIASKTLTLQIRHWSFDFTTGTQQQQNNEQEHMKA